MLAYQRYLGIKGAEEQGLLDGATLCTTQHTLTIYVVVVVLSVPIMVYAPMDGFEPHPMAVDPHGTPGEPVVPIVA